MLKVLHLLSQKSLTGAEVYANALTQLQVSDGYTVFQVSNGFYSEEFCPRKVLSVESDNKIQHFKSIQQLTQFVHENKIQVIHSHSRAASKLAYAVQKKINVALVSTIHGRQHVSWSKKIKNIYGQYLIPVCENIQTQLIQEFGYNPHHIRLIPNGVDSSLFQFKNPAPPQDSKFKITIIGRLSGPKKYRTELILQKILEFEKTTLLNQRVQIHLIGDGELDSKLIQDYDQSNIELKHDQYQPLNSDFLHQYHLVIGSGRVCIEALMSGVPCLAMGESNYVGLIKEENFNIALQTNFGDIGLDFNLPPLPAEQFLQDLKTSLKTEELFKLSQKTLNQFELKTIHQKIIRTYESAYFKKNAPNWFPILMYHKIPKQNLNSEHKIYVTESKFEKHLQFFKNQGFTSLTFDDLNQFKKGLRSFSEFPKNPLVLTFDDGYQDNLENADPLLKKYNFKAQLFLLADPQISSNQWDQKKNQSSDSEHHPIIHQNDRKKWLTTNFKIGSHGFRHQKITQMTKEEKIIELRQSKEHLEKEFQHPIIVYAYTYGDTNTEAAELAQQAGYEYAVNTDQGGLHIEDHPYGIFRINIFPDETFFSLWKKTSRYYRKYFQLKRGK